MPVNRRRGECGHCGRFQEVYSLVEGSPRCAACYQYRRRHGIERPRIGLLRQEARKLGMKVCGKCERVLSPSEFHASKRYGTQSHCKDCQRQNMREWIAVNPDGRHRWFKKYAESGRKNQAWHRYRARKLEGHVADVDPWAIFARDRWRCGICGGKVSRKLKHPDPGSASIDHIVPLSLGGTHEPRNVQCAHLGCNASKGHRGGGEQLRLIG